MVDLKVTKNTFLFIWASQTNSLTFQGKLFTFYVGLGLFSEEYFISIVERRPQVCSAVISATWMSQKFRIDFGL